MKVVTQIRSTGQSWSYKSGEWVTIIGVELALFPSGRPCFVIEFKDGETDLWSIYDDGAGYEFCRVNVLEPGDV